MAASPPHPANHVRSATTTSGSRHAPPRQASHELPALYVLKPRGHQRGVSEKIGCFLYEDKK